MRGEINWFGKGERDPELEEAAFSLEKDQVSDIIKTADGYQIIKVIGKRGGGMSTLPEVEKKIKVRLQAQKMEDEKQRYYEKAGVKILKEK